MPEAAPVAAPEPALPGPPGPAPGVTAGVPGPAGSASVGAEADPPGPPAVTWQAALSARPATARTAVAAGASRGRRVVIAPIVPH